MNVNASLLMVEFPGAANQALHWWHVADGAVLAKGCDADPLLAAGLQNETEAARLLECIALVPASMAMVRWHDLNESATHKQALMAAIIEAKDSSLSSDAVHVAAASNMDEVASASIDRDTMANGLVYLQDVGLDPAIITPAGWLVPPAEDAILSIDLGFEKLLRGTRIIAPDEAALRPHIIGDHPVVDMDDDTLDHHFANIEPAQLLNLRAGVFAKKNKQAMTHKQKRLLGWLVAALVIVSIAIPALQLAKYHWATNSADNRSIAAAEPVIGSVKSAQEADQKLGRELVQQNRGNIIFSVPASALFSAIQAAPGVSLERLSYRQDGSISAALTAVRNEEMNPVLLTLQNAGFTVTATPRTDATGVSKADITVRAQ